MIEKKVSIQQSWRKLVSLHPELVEFVKAEDLELSPPIRIDQFALKDFVLLRKLGDSNVKRIKDVEAFFFVKIMIIHREKKSLLHYTIRAYKDSFPLSLFAYFPLAFSPLVKTINMACIETNQ
jgi:hypothetical protein